MKSIVRRVCLVSVLALAVGAFAAEKQFKALFVGNSYCDFHVIPGQVAKMIEKDGRSAICKRETKGGFSWPKHWNAGRAQERIKSEEKWDVIVLQNHSRSSLDDPDNFYTYGQKFIDLVKTTSATPVLYLTWAREHQPEDQKYITEAYCTLGVKNKVAIAPVGEAFKAFHQKYPDVILHAADKSHPSMIGACISACVLYSTITGNSPVGQLNQIEGYNWVTKGNKLADIEPAMAKKVQQVAWDTVKSFNPQKYALAKIPAAAGGDTTEAAQVTVGSGTLQINFGGKKPVAGWNNVGGDKSPAKALVDAEGNQTSATIEVHDAFQSFAHPAVFKGELKGETKLFEKAADATLFTHRGGGNPTGGVKLKLDPAKSYTLKIWASRQGNGMRWARYIVKGQSEEYKLFAAGCDRPAGNVSKVLTFSGVKPAADGTIELTVAFPTSEDRFKNLGNFAYLTGMIVQPE